MGGGLMGAEPARRRLDKRAARTALAAGRRRRVVWAEGMAGGLRLTCGVTTEGRRRRQDGGWIVLGGRSVAWAEIDRTILRAAREEVVKAAPPAERLAVRASLRNPVLVLDELEGLERRGDRLSWWERERLGQARALAEAGVAAVWRTAERVVVVGRPEVEIAAGVPHALDRPAVRWRREALWLWQGIWMPAAVAARRESLDGAVVLAEPNAERRRVLIDAIGVERFLATTGAEVVQQDDYGRLWRLEAEVGGEPFAAVEVVNATEEPDGSRRRYFLRVPPATRTAREAVAWTFGFDDPAAYEPVAQS